MSKILIGGYYGHGNAGDEAILAGMLDALRALRPDLAVTVASGDPARTTAEHGVRALAAGDLPALIAAVAASDLVILGGGGLFQDYWPVPEETFLTERQGGLLAYLAYPALAALLGRPAMIYAAGVGPLSTEEGRRLTRVAFELCRRSTVRDPGSLALLAEIAPGLPVELAADPAFHLQPAAGPEIDRLLASLGIGTDERLTGVALRPWDFGVSPAVWEAEVARGLALHLTETPGKLLFLPFQSEAGTWEDDLAVSRRVATAVGDPERALVIGRGSSPAELAGLLGRCERVLAMRYHAALFALAAGVPAAALAYDPKVASLLDEAGLGSLALPPARWQAEEIAAALRQAGAPGPRESLASFAGDQRRRAGRAAAAALEALDAGPPQRSEADRFLASVAMAKVQAVLRLEVAEAEGRAEGWELRRLLDATQAELSEARDRLQELDRERSALREQRDLILAERSDLDRRLTAFERTLAYRLVSRFWRLMGKVFPEGSRRRKVYRLGRRAVGKLLGTPPAPLPAAAPAVDAPDPRADLLHFEERARAGGSPRVVAIFSGTQLLESEGQRPTQLALALARRGTPVVFVYWRWWDHEWRPQDRLEDGICQIPIDVVTRRPEMLAGVFAEAERIALFEFPYPGFFETLAAASSAGWITVYDVIDDWEEFHRVGQAVWYDEEFERHLIGACDAVFAINEPLAARVRALGGPGVELLGNGLKAGIAEVREPRPLARGEVTVGYFGYLAGAWFDWELIAESARRRPAWRFYLIGYGGSPEGTALPENVELLGKQPQPDLAAFAANWDVAVIPFKPDRLAVGADPIKTYEYLAMGLPVVVTGVHPPAGAEDLVDRAEGVEDFLRAVERAASRRSLEETAARRAFAAGCTWDHRLESLLAALAAGRQRVAEKRALFEVRP
ncbi:MAG TPA: polysaccharide pyruvyl transferase family protein [Thermoanaerobaculia bacterium]